MRWCCKFDIISLSTLLFFLLGMMPRSRGTRPQAWRFPWLQSQQVKASRRLEKSAGQRMPSITMETRTGTHRMKRPHHVEFRHLILLLKIAASSAHFRNGDIRGRMEGSYHPAAEHFPAAERWHLSLFFPNINISLDFFFFRFFFLLENRFFTYLQKEIASSSLFIRAI